MYVNVREIKISFTNIMIHYHSQVKFLERTKEYTTAFELSV